MRSRSCTAICNAKPSKEIKNTSPNAIRTPGLRQNALRRAASTKLTSGSDCWSSTSSSSAARRGRARRMAACDSSFTSSMARVSGVSGASALGTKSTEGSGGARATDSVTGDGAGFGTSSVSATLRSDGCAKASDASAEWTGLPDWSTRPAASASKDASSAASESRSSAKGSS